MDIGRQSKNVRTHTNIRTYTHSLTQMNTHANECLLTTGGSLSLPPAVFTGEDKAAWRRRWLLTLKHQSVVFKITAAYLRVRLHLPGTVKDRHLKAPGSWNCKSQHSSNIFYLSFILHLWLSYNKFRFVLLSPLLFTLFQIWPVLCFQHAVFTYTPLCCYGD